MGVYQLAATCPCTRAIDRSSHAGSRSILVPTSLAKTRADESELRVPCAPIRTPEWSSRLSGHRRILFTQPHGMPEHERHIEGCILPYTFSHLIYPSLATVPFLFWGESRHGWGLFEEYISLRKTTPSPPRRFPPRDNYLVSKGRRATSQKATLRFPKEKGWLLNYRGVLEMLLNEFWKITAQKALKLLHFGKTAPLFPNIWANVINFFA